MKKRKKSPPLLVIRKKCRDGKSYRLYPGESIQIESDGRHLVVKNVGDQHFFLRR